MGWFVIAPGGDAIVGSCTFEVVTAWITAAGNGTALAVTAGITTYWFDIATIFARLDCYFNYQIMAELGIAAADRYNTKKYKEASTRNQ